MKCWEEALKEDPAHLESNFNYGYLRWKRGETWDNDCVTRMRGLEGSKGSDPDYWLCLGWIHLERGDVEEVEKIQKSEVRSQDSG